MSLKKYDNGEIDWQFMDRDVIGMYYTSEGDTTCDVCSHSINRTVKLYPMEVDGEHKLNLCPVCMKKLGDGGGSRNRPDGNLHKDELGIYEGVTYEKFGDITCTECGKQIEVYGHSYIHIDRPDSTGYTSNSILLQQEKKLEDKIKMNHYCRNCFKEKKVVESL